MPQNTSWTFAIITLGCKVNQYESQAIAETWQSLGGTEVKELQHAEVILLNSCAITAKGERDTRSALYNIKRNNNNTLRILSGCAANLVASSIDQDYFDIVVPARAKATLLKGPWQFKDNPQILPNQSSNPFGADGFNINSYGRTRPIIKVQDGCSHGCTYCIVPLVRGPSISRAPEEVLAEAKRLLQAGYCEITLSGINLHHYGRDLSLHHINDFWDLVQFLDRELAPQFATKARLRISSLEPSQITTKGLDILQSSRLLCPHLHLSLQHGSRNILKAMGRGHYKIEPLKNSIKELRQSWEYMGLGADILMGFPGEEDTDVKQTLELVGELALSYAHVFPYSKRPGTKASTFKNQVPHELKLARANEVRQLVETQKTAFLNRLLQKQYLEIIIDNTQESCQEHPKIYKGIDAHYAPCRIHLSERPTNGIIKAKAISIKNQTLIVNI